MSIVKSKRLSKTDRLDLVFRALGDSTRRKLIAKLSRGPSMVTELAEPFDISLPAVSRHIGVLERARLVERNVDGRVHLCSLKIEPLRDVERWLSHYRHFWEATLDSLADYAERGQEKKQKQTREK
ncbi:MAG TPA: metalloregulator ArsR/SmtB family transcription factor [Tepidisphaeraceae bacterium]